MLCTNHNVNVTTSFPSILSLKILQKFLKKHLMVLIISTSSCYSTGSKKSDWSILNLIDSQITIQVWFQLWWHVYKLDVSLLSFRWLTVRSTISGNDMDNVTIVNWIKKEMISETEICLSFLNSFC